MSVQLASRFLSVNMPLSKGTRYSPVEMMGPQGIVAHSDYADHTDHDPGIQVQHLAFHSLH